MSKGRWKILERAVQEAGGGHEILREKRFLFLSDERHEENEKQRNVNAGNERPGKLGKIKDFALNAVYEL